VRCFELKSGVTLDLECACRRFAQIPSRQLESGVNLIQMSNGSCSNVSFEKSLFLGMEPFGFPRGLTWMSAQISLLFALRVLRSHLQ
jgi:hypothetical protein